MWTTRATKCIGFITHALGRQAEVQGDLGYFGLGHWWLHTFTLAQQEYIEAAYQPPDLPAASRPLTKGKRSSDAQTAACLLTAIATGLFKRPDDRGLACQILAKAEDRALAEGDMLGLHFTYQEMVRLHHTWREQFTDALDLAFAASYKQMRIAPQVAAAFHEAYPDKPLPPHIGYEMMAAILEKQGDYAQAIDLCKQARSQNWPGNWDWRIQRMTKKLGYPVTFISSAGITPITL